MSNYTPKYQSKFKFIIKIILKWILKIQNLKNTIKHDEFEKEREREIIRDD